MAKAPEASCPSGWRALCPRPSGSQVAPVAPIFPPCRMVQIPVHCFMLTGPSQARAPRSGSNGNPAWQWGVGGGGSSTDTLFSLLNLSLDAGSLGHLSPNSATLPHLFCSASSPDGAILLSRTFNSTPVVQFCPFSNPKPSFRTSCPPSSAQVLPPCHPPLLYYLPHHWLRTRRILGSHRSSELGEGEEMVQPEKRKGKRSQAARWAGEEGK